MGDYLADLDFGHRLQMVEFFFFEYTFSDRIERFCRMCHSLHTGECAMLDMFEINTFVSYLLCDCKFPSTARLLYHFLLSLRFVSFRFMCSVSGLWSFVIDIMCVCAYAYVYRSLLEAVKWNSM